MQSNPLGEFVELPDNYNTLKYSNLLCGAIRYIYCYKTDDTITCVMLLCRGGLEMVHLEVAAWFAQDSLKGDNVTELRVKFIRKIEDTVPAGDD